MKRLLYTIIVAVSAIFGWNIYQAGDFRFLFSSAGLREVRDSAVDQYQSAKDWVYEIDNPITDLIPGNTTNQRIIVDAGQYAYAGIPNTRFRDITILENEGFLIGYDNDYKIPAFGCYKLHRVYNYEYHKRPSSFKQDRRIPLSSSHSDYTHSGYDRGHCVPNFAIMSRYGRAAQLDTFLMTNIFPQRPNFNRGVWRQLEDTVVNNFANLNEEVWVITGSILDSEIERLESGVEIPDAFFKIVTDIKDQHIRVLSFILNEDANNKDLNSYLTSVDHIEKLTGLDFFHKLADVDEDVLEEWVPAKIW